MNIPSARKLTKDLKSKIAKIETKETKAAESIEAKDARVIKANVLRTSKMKRHHSFVDKVYNLALENDVRKADGSRLTYLDVRRQYDTRKQGKDVSIPSVIWENPSP
ncbi:MAG: hypothetical protein EX285_05300 [Thaumarchaeota archaeon]|nr:hypothetical protein [Nitrososphaerota archaeon]